MRKYVKYVVVFVFAVACVVGINAQRAFSWCGTPQAEATCPEFTTTTTAITPTTTHVVTPTSVPPGEAPGGGCIEGWHVPGPEGSGAHCLPNNIPIWTPPPTTVYVERPPCIPEPGNPDQYCEGPKYTAPPTVPPTSSEPSTASTAPPAVGDSDTAAPTVPPSSSTPTPTTAKRILSLPPTR